MQKTFRIIGLMTGTSMDGIDASLIETDGEFYIQRISHASLSYEKDFQLELKKQEGAKSAENILPEIVKQSTLLHASLVKSLLEKINITNQDIDAVGYHGQTLYHNPKEKISFQMGDAELLANTLKIPVVYDFRMQDVLAGGQGAPLAPLYHQALMIEKKLPKMIFVNCGGIANISVISGPRYEDIQAGFDTGPGNVLLDQFVRKWTEQKYNFDLNGQFAQQGKIDEDFLKLLLEKTAKDYYQKKPPKSLDSKEIKFIPETMEYFPQTNMQSLYDGCATLAAFTAKTIADSRTFIKNSIPNVWVISGGGAKNNFLVDQLKKYLGPEISLYTADQMSWSTTYMEAELMAWLAARVLRKLPLTIPQTTGVKEPMVGGKIFLISD